MRHVTIEYTVVVEAEVRDDVAHRGRWLKPITIARDEDWQEYDEPPVPNTLAISIVRRDLNEMWQDTGVSSADVHFRVKRVKGGRITKSSKDGQA